MNRARVFTVFLPFLVVSVIHLVALLIEERSVSVFTKPLLMPLLGIALLFSLPRIRSEIALLAGLGILFSWAGDVLLASPGDLGFLIGLGCFLLAHVAYITLFLRRLRKRPIQLASVVYLAWLVALVWILAPHLGSLLIPVVAYGVVLSAMGIIALSCNAWIAIGGALFVVSDSLLGLNRFLPGFEPSHVDFLIMLSYLLAQGLIAAGVIREAWNKALAPDPEPTGAGASN